VDLLDLLPEDTEIDIAPDLVDPAYALKISNPLAEGELDAPDAAVSSSFDLDADLPDFGRMESELKPAAIGQITVDPGAVQVDDGEMMKFTEDLIKRGNNGLVDNGKLDGIESLDELLDLPPNLLLSKKTLLPSDLLFEFNRAELRESAKVGLMKLALLIDEGERIVARRPREVRRHRVGLVTVEGLARRTLPDEDLPIEPRGGEVLPVARPRDERDFLRVAADHGGRLDRPRAALEQLHAGEVRDRQRAARRMPGDAQSLRGARLHARRDAHCLDGGGLIADVPDAHGAIRR
jgi:hypothetical protein